MIADPERFKGRRVGLVLSGGNIDTRLLASVLTRELAREGRLIATAFDIADRPGQLGRSSASSARPAPTSSRFRISASSPIAGQGGRARSGDRDGTGPILLPVIAALQAANIDVHVGGH